MWIGLYVLLQQRWLQEALRANLMKAALSGGDTTYPVLLARAEGGCRRVWVSALPGAVALTVPKMLCTGQADLPLARTRRLCVQCALRFSRSCSLSATHLC